MEALFDSKTNSFFTVEKILANETDGSDRYFLDKYGDVHNEDDVIDSEEINKTTTFVAVPEGFYQLLRCEVQDGKVIISLNIEAEEEELYRMRFFRCAERK